MRCDLREKERTHLKGKGDSDAIVEIERELTSMEKLERKAARE